MKSVLIVMLAVQAAILLVAIYSVGWKRSSGDKPNWSSLAISLLVVGMTSITIANGRVGMPGADLVGFFGPLLLGMGLFSALLGLRERRQLRAA